MKTLLAAVVAVAVMYGFFRLVLAPLTAAPQCAAMSNEAIYLR